MSAEAKHYLDRAGVLEFADRVIEELYIPEWQAHVRLATWDGATRWRVIQLWPAPGVPGRERPDLNLLALVASVSLVDADGRRLFSDEDVAALATKNARALDRIFSAALRLNGLDQASVDALGKDSAPSPNGASTSTSRAS
jgi:hypothetical protein